MKPLVEMRPVRVSLYSTSWRRDFQTCDCIVDIRPPTSILWSQFRKGLIALFWGGPNARLATHDSVALTEVRQGSHCCPWTASRGYLISLTSPGMAKGSWWAVELRNLTETGRHVRRLDQRRCGPVFRNTKSPSTQTIMSSPIRH
jgi:hypothetical protein